VIKLRLVQLEEYDQETMVLAKPVYDAKGRVLLAVGNRLHPRYLSKLVQLEITFLVIEDVASAGITLDEMVDMPTWVDAIQILEEVFNCASKQELIPVRKLQKLSAKLLDEVRKRKAVMLIPSTSVAEDLQLYAHSVNVALISIQIGKVLKYNELQLRDLALGSLLHDVGKAVTDKVEEHPEKGFQILRKARELNLMSAHMAFQHHERLDGDGFPRGIKGEDFIEFAQVCSVSNEYENMISKQNISPYSAMEMIMVQTDKSYSHAVIDALFKGIPSYLPGTQVKLNTGDIAIVTRIDSHLHRPSIRYIETGEEIALEDHSTIIIMEEVKPDKN
jgi:putative nucleotidyltransferase with HDIG domain